jgi:WD40 repeat protein/serine/threonine protein kinase
MPADLQKARELFLHAVGKLRPEQWDDYVAKACGGDAELEQQVGRFLQVHREAGSFLEEPAGNAAAQSDAPATRWPALSPDPLPVERPGTVIGPYKLLQQIGEGGMGTVFMAEQTHPVRRKVALKVIKPGMDSRQVIARFEAERQALAMMDNVSIARVLDAGATESGRPYFVMELVNGVSITKYCDENRLTPRARLELFVPVCQAIQHAHQKGIIHRDVKPSNVMITLYDGKPVPKVIDFGVAKATEQKLTERTLFTQYGTMVGTLEYMSPEQAEMSGLGVDTRSDIYSLGVLLYELLTGSTPLTHKRIKEAGYGEILRMIKEEEPPKPSTRLSDSGETLASISAQRHMEPAKLTKLVRGELDWIVMKALDKDRNRRYETASGLAADVRRYLNDEPVHACPPSAWYRFRKFARRNKAALAMASVVGLAVVVAVAGLATSTFLIAREQRVTANALQAETRAKDDLRSDACFHRITLAHRELSLDNLKGALKLLDDCPEDLRQWEWDYLMRLCRFEPLVLRDTSGVNSVAFHPDGNQIAAACGDSTVKVWDLKTGKVIQTLRGHKSYVFSVAFRPPDGRFLASASADRTIRVWDLTTGAKVFECGGHLGEFNGMAYAVAFSPDGRHLLAGSEDGSAILWDAADGREVRRLPEKHENTAVSVAFSRDGRLLASGSWGGVLRIWEARTGRLLHSIPAHDHRISAIAFDPDGRWLATASADRTVKVWDATTGEPLRTLHGHVGLILGLAFSPNGRRLFSSGGEDKSVKVWDPLTGREILDLRGHASLCQCVTLSPDGRRLASASADRTICIWDATPLSVGEGQESLTCKHDDEIWSVAFSPDGRQLASASWDKTVRLWDARTGNLLHTLARPGSVFTIFRLAFSPDGERIAVAATSTERTALVQVWDTRTGQEVFTIPDKSPPFFVTFDPKGRYLVKEGPGFTVKVWDARTGHEVGILGRHEQPIWSMAFSPDGHRLASASTDGKVKVWAWDPTRLGKTQEPELQLSAGITPGYGERVAFSPDGLLLVTGGEGQTVQIWDAKTGQARELLRGHTGDVFAVAFSPDGRWLASAGEDTTVRLWDAKSWKLRRTLRGHVGVVGTLAFSPDSLWLASGSRDHTLKVWAVTRWDEQPEQK